MLNSRQRAFLRGMANDYECILYVGKGGLSDALVSQADGALKTRELIKGKALEASPLTSREAADQIAEATNAEVVQVIGRVFILYRRNDEKPVISDQIPKAKKK